MSTQGKKPTTTTKITAHLKLQHYNEDGTRNIKSGRAYHATSQLMKWCKSNLIPAYKVKALGC